MVPCLSIWGIIIFLFETLFKGFLFWFSTLLFTVFFVKQKFLLLIKSNVSFFFFLSRIMFLTLFLRSHHQILGN